MADLFPTVEEMREILDAIIETLPQELFKELNGGILLLPQVKYHPASREEDALYIKGEYSRSVMGRQICIYYGSFEKLYGHKNLKRIEKELKHTLLHEFTHHLESLAGEKGLEIEDAIRLAQYKDKEKKGEGHDKEIN